MRHHRNHGMCYQHCNGHGHCLLNINCECHKDQNGDPDWTGPDCSIRACPMGVAWVAPPTPEAMAANLHPRMECSNKGLCDRRTGLCTCFPGYDGHACHRHACPNLCSGHGNCYYEKHFAQKAGRTYDLAWDAEHAMGCQCFQGYRGIACELKECHSGPDPLGGYGNEAGRDCSGRGICNYETGRCECFKDWFGERCSIAVVLS